MAPKKWNRIFEKIQNKSGKEKITIVVLTGILLLVISLPTGSKSVSYTHLTLPTNSLV